MARWSFGPFTFDRRAFRLDRDGVQIPVQPKPLDLLARLLETPGEVATRADLNGILYPDTVVSEHALRNVVLKLREALGPAHDGWVETVPRRGVRFVGPVEVVEGRVAPDEGRRRFRLPAERDRFVGRAPELAQVERALGTHRLVTLVGLGGAGKTRLAVRAAWAAVDRYPGGVWFVDLDRAHDEVGHAVARALDVPLGAGDPIVQVGHCLAARGRCLVVLDGHERSGRPAIEPWLDAAPELQILVTSRERTGLVGERVVEVGPLTVDDGAALFVTRAEAVDPQWALPDDPDAIPALVRALDALPLALELAASRMRSTTVPALTRHLGSRLEGLRATDGRPARHQSLRAALDGSWELLSDDDRRALARLTVFDGGFDADAADAVAGPLDLGALVDRSWVQVGADKRFSLLRVVRAYVAERGVEPGDAEARHGAWFSAVGRAALDLPNPSGALAPELANLVAACRRASARGDAPVAADTLIAACAVLDNVGPSSLAIALAEGVPGGDPRVLYVRAQAELTLGRTEAARASLAEARERAVGGGDRRLLPRIDAAWAGLTGGLGRLDEALAAAERAVASGDDRVERTALLQLGNVHRFAGRFDAARDAYERSLSAADRADDARVRCYALGNLGVVLHHGLGRLDEARSRYEQALAEARRAGVSRYEGNILGNLGALCDEQLRDADAAAYYRAALALHRALGSRREVGGVLGNFANLLVRLRRFDEARAAYDEALVIHREVGNRREEGIALQNLGSMWVARGDPSRAFALFDQALAIHHEVGNRRFVGHCHDAIARGHARRGSHDAARAALSVALELHREGGNAMNQAETLVELARIELAAGHPADATAAADEALALARGLGDPVITAAALVRTACNALAERPADARRALAEAEALAQPHWPVAAEIAAARAQLAQQASSGRNKPAGASGAGQP